jgi:hypothetical protein
MNIPPWVFPIKVALDPLNFPPREEVRIMEASVLFPEESVIIKVMVVVAFKAMVLFPAKIETLAGAPPDPELPDPVDVPLVTLSRLLISDVPHPGNIITAAPSKKNKKIIGVDLWNIALIPNY